MKPAMALLGQEQKDGHFQLFQRMYSLQTTLDNKGQGRWKGGGVRIGLWAIRRHSYDPLLNSFVVACLCVRGLGYSVEQKRTEGSRKGERGGGYWKMNGL